MSQFLVALLCGNLMNVSTLCSDHREKGHDYRTFLHVLRKTFHFSVSIVTFWLSALLFLFKLGPEPDHRPLLWLMKLDSASVAFISSVHSQTLTVLLLFSPPSLTLYSPTDLPSNSVVLSEGTRFQCTSPALFLRCDIWHACMYIFVQWTFVHHGQIHPPSSCCVPYAFAALTVPSNG